MLLRNFFYNHFLVAIALILWGGVWVMLPKMGDLGRADSVIWGIMFGAVCVSSYTDCRWRKIYNIVTYPAFVVLVILNIVAIFGVGGKNLGSIGLEYALAGGVSCLVIAGIPYITGSGGAGDAKLGTVIGVALGIKMGVITILISFLVASVLSVSFLIWNRGPLFVLKMIYHRIGNFFVPLWILPVSKEQQKALNEPFPMAPCFCLGIIITCIPQVRNFFG